MGWSSNRLLLVVGLYSACVAFKPSEPFLVAFLECFKGISHSSVVYEVFPVWTYSYLLLLPPLAAGAELVGHRQIVLLGASARFGTTLILLLPTSSCSVPLMQLSQVTIAAGFASHPALSAIMYRGMPRESYARAAGTVASLGVFAEVLASLLGQLLVSVRARGARARACASTTCAPALTAAGRLPREVGLPSAAADPPPHARPRPRARVRSQVHVRLDVLFQVCACMAYMCMMCILS